MRKIWKLFLIELPIIIFTILWLGLYVGLVELKILPSGFSILVIWMFVWLLVLVYLIDLVENRNKKHD